MRFFTKRIVLLTVLYLMVAAVVVAIVVVRVGAGVKTVINSFVSRTIISSYSLLVIITL